MKRSHPVQVTLKEIFNRKSCKLVEPAFNFSGFTVINTPPDGQCMFSALAHQLSIGVEITDTPTSAIDVRKQLVTYLRQHPACLSECGTVPEGFDSIDNYLNNMEKEDVWGDGIILSAASMFYNRPIHVVSSNNPTVQNIINTVIHNESSFSSKPMFIGYVECPINKRANHYVSLIPLPVDTDAQQATSLGGASKEDNSNSLHICLDNLGDAIAAPASELPLHGSQDSTPQAHQPHSTPAVVVADAADTFATGKVKLSADDLGTESPAQPHLPCFPGTVFGSKRKSVRKFQESWYVRPWLEYSESRDRCFCFACRNFADVNCRDQDPTFVKLGFSNWRTALEVDRGFSKHEQSKSHIVAMMKWSEYKHRLLAGKTVEMQLSCEQLMRNQYYVKSIAEVVISLAVNELAYRGDTKREADPGETAESRDVDGLFLRLFEFTMQKDQKLKNIAMSIPKNAKYTSPEIQNEIIATLAEMVQKKIVEKFHKSDIGLCCLKCDETRDASNVEVMSVCLRFVCDGKPIEHLLSIVKLNAVDAKSITGEIIRELKARNVDPQNILSTCFDGAAVMSGCFGGVQKLLSDELKLSIPYVHCYNHRLHLVVVHSIHRVSQAKQFFSTCEHLYVFFRRQFLSTAYHGHTLKRVLEQRWTGHLQSAKVILENRSEILTALDDASDACIELSVEAAGLRVHVLKPQFAFIATIVVKILTVLQPANAMLQSKTVNVSDAADMIRSSIEKLEELRSDEMFYSLAKDAGCTFPITGTGDGTATHSCSQQVLADAKSKQKRVQRLSKKLDDYLVFSTTGNNTTELTDGNQQNPESVRLRRIYFDVLDNVVGELKTRFESSNVSLSSAVSALLPGTDNCFSADRLSPLTELMRQHKQFDSGLFTAELQIAHTLLNDKLKPEEKNDLQQVALNMLPYKQAFPTLYWHYAAALTVGISTATCENTFSCLTRVLKPYRVSMSNERKCNLVLLAFEKSITQKLDLNDFLSVFKTKSRRLLL